MASVLSFLQACNETLEYFKNDDTIYKINIVNKESKKEQKKYINTENETKNELESGKTKNKPIIEPISKTIKHKKTTLCQHYV